MSLRVALRSLLARIEAGSSGYLDQVGWIRSRAEQIAVDVSGQPVPWFTYPAIHLLADRVQPDWRVLEFGAGMGTLWWSRRVATVVAVEHDAQWVSFVSARCKQSILYVGAEQPDRYVQAGTERGPYDIVIVDGLHRNECLLAAPGLIGSGGAIVLDDSQRGEYRPGIQALRELGFRALELHGPQPVSKHQGCTTIFYRSNNVLGL